MKIEMYAQPEKGAWLVLDFGGGSSALITRSQNGKLQEVIFISPEDLRKLLRTILETYPHWLEEVRDEGAYRALQ